MQIRFLLAAYFHNALKFKKTYSYRLYLLYPNDNSIRMDSEALHELILMFKMNMTGKPKGHGWKTQLARKKKREQYLSS